MATTYPDGEVVATTYNRQGLAETLAGDDSYVDEAEYNALGQVKLLDFDDNGNMTLRVEKNVTYQQAWDAENRLASVTNQTAGEVTAFTYDGDGALVKKVDAGGTTYYLGRHYEVHVPAAGGTQAAASAPSAALEIAALEATARAVDQEAGAMAEERCLAAPEAAGCEGWRVVRGGAAREGPFLEDLEGEETPPPAGTEGGSGQPQRAPASGLPDLGFESGEGWSEVTNEDFPATSFYWGTGNTAEPHGGSHAYALSNHSYGYLESVPITVTAGTAYSSPCRCGGTGPRRQPRQVAGLGPLLRGRRGLPGQGGGGRR